MLAECSYVFSLNRLRRELRGYYFDHYEYSPSPGLPVKSSSGLSSFIRDIHLSGYTFIRVIPSSGSYLHPGHTFIRVIPSFGSYLHPGHTFTRVIPSSGSYIHPGHTFIRVILSSGTYIHPGHTFIRDIHSSGTKV